MSGSEDRGGGGSSIQFINFGKVGDKVLKNYDKNRKVGDSNILTFFCPPVLDKKCHFHVYF